MDLDTNDGALAPAMDSAMSAPEVTTDLVTTEAPAVSIDDTLKSVYDKLHPTRAPDGKFASKEPQNAAEPAEPPSDQPAEQAPVETAVKPSIDPPNSWSSEQKAKWASIPPEAQEYIARRETEAHQAITRAGQRLKEVEPVTQVLDAYAQDFASRGVSPAQGIAILANAQRQLDANPVQGLIEIAKSYGIDLSQAFQGDGRAQTVAPEVNELRSEIAQLKGYLTQQQRAQHDAQMQTLQSEISAFAKDKPYFDEVRPTMAALLQNGQAETLDAAYDMAVHALPTTRSRILEDQRKADEAKRAAEQKAKADQAKRATSVNVRSGPAAGASPRTMDETLREIARSHGLS